MTLLRLEEPSEDPLVQPIHSPPYKRANPSRLLRAISSQIFGRRRQTLEVTGSSLPSKTTISTLGKKIPFISYTSICTCHLFNCHRLPLALSSPCSYQILTHIGKMLLSHLFSKLNNPRFLSIPLYEGSSKPFISFTALH